MWRCKIREVHTVICWKWLLFFRIEVQVRPINGQIWVTWAVSVTKKEVLGWERACAVALAGQQAHCSLYLSGMTLSKDSTDQKDSI